MGFLSFALIALFFAQLSAASPQATASQLPAITGPANGPSQCGGCYVVADVAGIVFGTQTFTQTHVAIVSIGVGANGTNVTTTSITAGAVPFTFNPSGLTPGVLSINTLGPILTISGVELTSPTAYDVFTAYSITSTIFTNGQCSVVSGLPSTLSSAFRIARPANAGADFDSFAEDQFISAIGGLPICSPGGVNSVQTSQIPVSLTTTTTTTVGPIKATLTPQAESTPSVKTVSSTVPAKTTTSSATVTTTVVIVPITTPLTLPTASTTKTSVISVGTIIIVSNSTYLQTGAGASATIIPFKGEAANMRMDLTSSWLLWGSGIFGTLVALCAL